MVARIPKEHEDAIVEAYLNGATQRKPLHCLVTTRRRVHAHLSDEVSLQEVSEVSIVYQKSTKMNDKSVPSWSYFKKKLLLCSVMIKQRVVMFLRGMVLLQEIAVYQKSTKMLKFVVFR